MAQDDVPAWHALRERLWPGIPRDETESFARDLFGRREDWAVFVCGAPSGIVGFVEAHLREYADGCQTSPVGYVEGWYVVEEHRRVGIGRRLIAAAEEWARSRGCTEMASDALIDNILSHTAHRALGYAEVERMVVFRKTLS